MTIKTKRNASLLNSSSLFVLGTASVLLGSGPAQAFDANTLPTGGNVTGGAATIATSGNTLTVNQSSNRAIIDWRSFNIGANAQANFVQPGTSSIAVNRVNGSTDPSRIDGGLHANGQVWVLNPNGVFFGKTARVDAAGVVATTANINDKAFMAGSNKLQMTGGDSGQVVNEGHISVGEGGLAAFVAPSVRNSGTIRARLGKVTLAAGDTYTLDLAGDRLVEIGLGSNKAVVDQSGKIVNAGGVIEISAKAAGQVVDAVINTSGVTDASSVRTVGGKIVLGADVINVAADASIKADGTSGGQIAAVANKTGNYAGSWSAQGTTGDGGQIETSGKTAHIASGIKINTLSAKGKAGNWTLDPDDLTVTDDATDAGSIDPNASTVSNATIEDMMATTGVTLQAKNSITVDGAIDTHAQTNAATLYLKDEDTVSGGLTINLNAAITLGANQHLTGDGTIVNVSSAGLIQNGVDAALSSGAAVNVAAGIYAPNVSINNKNNLLLIGASDAEIDVNPSTAQLNAITIGGNTSGVTVKGFKIRGEVSDPYTNFAFGSGISRGIFVQSGAQNFTITGNDIRNVRNGILIDGRNTGSVTGNTIDNTKGAISVQYTDGTAYDKSLDNTGATVITINGNSQGPNGNEWGINYHLNGYWNGVAGDELHPLPNPVSSHNYLANAPTLAWQQGMLDQSTSNGGMTIQDQAYASSNRTAVTVSNAGNDANQGSGLNSLATIQAGINAVVTGGTVNVKDGTYVIPSGSNYINVNKSLTLKGESEDRTIIDASNGSTYGLRITAHDGPVSLSDFTLYGVSNGYGLKAEATQGLTLTDITSQGAGKSEFDLNGVIGGTLTNLTANGAAVSGGAETAGNGISLTDSQNITLTGVTTENNAWGGLALYQSNSPTGYPTQETGISLIGTNTFNEANGIYAQDQSSTNNFGTIDLSGQGIQYVATAALGGTEGTYTYFQKTQQGAIDLAAAASSASATVQGYAGDSVNGNNVFTVGYNTGHTLALSINAAVNAAASGATINVNAGTYREQVVINKDLTLAGAGAGSTTIESPDVLTHSFSSGGTNRKAVISVEGANSVTIQNLTVDGREKGTANSYFIDLGVHNANADIENVRLTGATDTVLDGGQHGVGLAVFNDDDIARTVTLNDSSIDNFQKNGAAFYGHGLTANVTGNTVTGAGSISAIAQNGIVLIGAKGNVTGNTIGGISYSPDTVWATGIYLDDAAGSTVSGNTVNGAGGLTGSTLGLYAGNSAGTQITGNHFFGVEEGIDLATSATVTGNDFNNSANGIEIEASAAGAAISGNSFTNNLIQILGSDAAAVSGLLTGNTFDRSVVATGGADIYGDLQTAINTEADHSTLTLKGTFGAGANVNKAGDKLVGNDAVINVANGQDGLTISANDVSVSGLEIAGPATVSYLNYAWNSDVTRGVVVKTGVTGFAITDNDIHGTRNDILVDGHNSTGSITGNTIDNSKSGISVQYTDGTGIDISGNHEGAFGNEWGINLHLNGHYDSSDVYHDTTDKIANEADTTTQAALLALSAANGGLTVQDQGYNFSNRTAVTVATNGSDSNQGSALGALGTIQAGIKAVVTGGTVNVNDGTYVIAPGSYLDITKALTLKGQSQDRTIIDASNASTYGLRVQADNVSLSDFTLNGPTGGYGIKVEPLELTITPADRVHHFSIADVTETGSYKNGLDLNGVIGATISDVTVSGTTNGTGIAITDSADVTLTGNTTTGNAWGGLALYQHNATYDQQVNNITVDGTNSFGEANGVYMEDESANQDFGTVSIAGYDHAVKATVAPNDSYTWLQNGVQTAIDFAANAPTPASVQGWTGSAGDNHFTVGVSTGGTALSVNAALDASTTGGIIDVLSGTYAEDVAVTAPRTVNFDDATLDSLSVLANGSGATLSGSVKAGSVTAVGDIALGGDLSLDTSAAGGTIALANVDGAHNLTLNAGTGVVQAGGLGAATRLGAVDITADLIGLGATNQAASFDFNGDVALSAASTVIDTTVSSTAAGNITFAGDIFGTTDGGQSLTLSAGPGTGDKSANGDIAMNNAGIGTLRLGSMTVSGDDFTALTVDLAGGFTSQLSGNQLFAADTLNAGGDVNSNVAGNIGGHIVSGGNVNLASGGALSGDITGKVVSLTGQTVNSQVTANTLNVNAPGGGTVTGTFTPGTVSNGLAVNGKVVGAPDNTGGTGTGGTGNTANNFPNVNAQQLVVEGFALPAGTRIGANGQLILPPGTVIGLLSPGGGTPRVIMVQSVQELGALLDQGYSAIVIDLTGHEKATTKLASN